MYAGLNLLSFYNDSILSGANIKTISANNVVGPTLTDLQRYLKHWSSSSRTYRWLSNFLNVIKIIEVFLEMSVHKRINREKKWSLIVLLEIAKALGKLAMIYVTKGRPLIHPFVPERPAEFAQVDVKIREDLPESKYTGKQSNKTFDTISKIEGSLDSALKPPSSADSSVSSPTNLASIHDSGEYKNAIYRYLSNQAGTVVSL